MYAEEKGFEVEQVFPDDVTGTGDFMQRPGMVALINHLKNNSHTNYVVVFDDLKRFARDTMSYLQLRMLMRQYEAQVECPNFTFEDTPEGEFIETVLAAQGQLEAKQGKRQTIQKMIARLEAGYWVFFKPIGYDYVKAPGGGKILIRKEPIASIVTEALEGFASGRFQSKAEVGRFLESFPEYPKGKNGKVHPQRLEELLTKIIYAGYIECKPWQVSLRKAQHEPLISLETWEKIQARLKEKAYAPTRKDINKDFPLRGAVVCADCDKPMTACWSKGKTKRHPYYYCKTKGCVSRSKTIRREIIEGEFEALLKSVTPTQALIGCAKRMFDTLWTHRADSAKQRKAGLQQQRQTLEQQSAQLLSLILEAKLPAVVQAYEAKIADIENQKRLLDEKIANCSSSARPRSAILRTSLAFLENPYRLWASGDLAHQRAVLKLVFGGKLPYRKNEGFRTPKTTLPFKVLGDILTSENKMAERSGI
jgi:DNA invertase Pin-like site-specific DNA recombinase